MIRVVEVWKRYGGTFAVCGVSLEVYPGELVAFVGTNGSGKSTLMRLICGLDRPTHGVVRIGPLDTFRDRATVWTLVDYLSLDERLPAFYDTYENMALFAPTSTAGEIRRRADRLMGPDGLEMEEAERRLPVAALSTGKRQRAALATLEDRPIAIVDEPTSGFDPSMRRAFRSRLLARRGTTLLVTHDMLDVERVSRVFVLRAGRLAGWGPPPALARWCGARDAEGACEALAREGPPLLRTGMVDVRSDPGVEEGACAAEMRRVKAGGELALGRLVLAVVDARPPDGPETVRLSPADFAALRPEAAEAAEAADVARAAAAPGAGDPPAIRRAFCAPAAG